jgi:SSS family solute:Na+ symporter
LVFAFGMRPLFATVMLGMFLAQSDRARCLFRVDFRLSLVGASHHVMTLPYGYREWASKAANLIGELSNESICYPSEMAQNFWTAIYAGTTCFVVTIVISAGATRKPRRLKSSRDLVYSLTPKPKEDGNPGISNRHIWAEPCWQ